MTVTHLDHLNLTVRDFEETAAWYGRVFGFEVVEKETDAQGRPWGVLRAGDALLCIYENRGLRFEDNDARRARFASVFDLHFVAITSNHGRDLVLTTSSEQAAM